MGRYITGDIAHKLMFAVQPSDAADRFGSTGIQTQLEYYYGEEHLETIEEELTKLKPAFDKVSKFFEVRDSYTDTMLEEAGITSQEVSDYADYALGQKIKDCVLEQGECYFYAEI